MELVSDGFDDDAEAVILLHLFFDEFGRMDDGAVVASSEGITDVGERRRGEFAGEKHRDLTREGDIGRAAFACHVREADIVLFGDFALDEFDGDGFAGLFLEDVAEEIFEGFFGDRSSAHGVVGSDTGDGTFEAADIIADAVGEEIDDPRVDLDLESFGFAAEDRDTGFHIWGLQFSGHAPFKARDEALF